MAKQLNVSLAINANTSQAKQQIQGLINDLNKLSTISSQSFQTTTLTSGIMQAKTAAKELGAMLESSFNVDTGKLDLNKFNQSLKASGTTLTQYGNQLMALGPAGDKAFLQISQAIIETEAPLRRTSSLLKEFGTTLANTARWQISSSILHGFMGSVQKAYGYAQDLDKSLNNIRIVTGQNADQMAVFAEKANKAAKALSATTTEYTNASLIYYQQGLSDSEVQERTDVTIKMANVAGQSAEIVSDQMTAVWNNFDDGSKSLEYYADVMTALGAATASSTDEIAGGLEKFAAIGNTIGLSYEYAASALATITSNTRQSEEVVGTALKTIFARIQGLKLGETLEDGVSLNKYSEALQKVGISIFDSFGELKKMDNILDEMASKWGTLSKAQQAALAQTVAGVRQYTQLIALMENWNNGDNDSMMANLDTAYGSTGALQEQADIYAESWEASKDRVTASLEGIYDSILDKDFFTTFNNGLSGFLGAIETLVDAMGGMPGILMLIGAIGTRVFEDQIASGINNTLHSLKNFTGVSMLEIKQLKKEAYEYAMAMTAGIADRPGIQAHRDHLDRVYKLQIQTEEAMQGANAEQVEAIKNAYELAKGYSEVAVQAAAAQEEAEELNFTTQKQQSNKFGAGAQKQISDSTDVAIGLAGADLIREAKSVESLGLSMGGVGTSVTKLQTAIQNYKNTLKNTPDDQKAVTESANALILAMEGVGAATEQQSEAFNRFQEVVGQAATFVVDTEYDFNMLQTSLKDTSPTQQQAQQIMDLTNRMEQCGLPVKDLKDALLQYEVAVGDGSDEAATAAALQQLGEAFSKCKISAKDSDKAIKDYGISLVKNKKGSKEYRQTLKQMGDKLDDTVKSTKKVAIANKNNINTTNQANKAMDDYAQTLQKVKASASSFGSGAAKMTQGLSSMGMALSSLQGLWSTLTDPDTSGFEKFVAVLTSSGMVVGSLSSGLKGLKDGFSLMKTAADGTTSSLLQQAMQMKTAELQEDSWLAKIKTKIALKKAEKAASAESVATETAEAMATGMGAEAQEEKNEEEAKGIALNAAGAAGSVADAGAKGGEAVSTIAAGTAQGFLNTMLSPFIALIGAALVALLPYIAAMGVLVAVVGAVALAVTAENRALQEAEEREQRAADAAQKVSEEINEINQSLNNIESKTDAFKDLEEGTMEWYQTLHEVNAEVQTLIDKFPELQAMGAITIDDNGMLGITDEGKEYITQEAVKQQTTATNVQLRAEQNILRQKNENSWNDFQAIEGTMSEKNAKLLVAAYEAYGDAMFTSVDYAKQVFENINKQQSDGVKYVRDTDEAILEFVKRNEDLIKSQAENLDKIDQIEEQMISNRLAIYGSQRSVEQAVDLMGNTEFYSKTGSGNDYALNYTKDGQEKSFDMKQNFNYTDEDMPQEIKDFMAMQGEDVEYVAQRWGKLVLKVDGEEVKFSQDEVYDALGELYSGEAFEKKLRDNLKTSLGNAVSGIDDLSTEDLVNLDNLQIGIENAFGGIEGTEEKVKNTFNAIVSAYGNTQDALEQLSADTQYIDITGPEFQGQIKALEAGKISVKQFKEQVQELNAMGQIDSMGSFFSEQAESMGLDAEAATSMHNYAKHLMEIADESDQLSDELDTNAEAAAALSVQITKMNKGIDKLADGFEDWESVLKKSSKESMEYSEAMSGIKDALSDILDVEAEFISSDFVTENLSLIEQAATGSASAIEDLQNALAEDIMMNIAINNGIEEQGSQLTAQLQSLKDMLPDLEVGASIDISNMTEDEKAFVDACNKLIADANMTAEQATAAFKTIGFEPKFKTTVKEETVQKPTITTRTTNNSHFEGEFPNLVWVEEKDTTSWTSGYTPIKESYLIPALSTDGTEPQVETITKLAPPSFNNYSSSNKGGKSPGSGSKKSGSKPKKADKAKKSDIVERYKEIEDSLDDLRDTMEDTNKAADRLYGNARIKQMEKANKLLQQEIELTKQKKKEAEAYLKQDKINLNKAASNAGVSFQYNESGNITNYTTEMEKLYKQLDAEITKANADGNADENEQERIDKIQEKIDELKEAMEQYEETRELIEDLDNELDEKFYEWQDNNAEILNYKLEIDIELNDDELRKLDYYLGKTEDDFFQRAEAAGLMNQKLGVYTDNLNRYNQQYEELNQAYKNGEISQEAYIEGLNEINDGIYDNLENIQELDKEMMHYYGETLAAAGEEIDKITARMEHQTAVLEHYQSIVELAGKSTDYKKMGTVLEGKAETSKNEMIAAQEEYELYRQQADEKYALWKSAKTKEEAEMYKQQYEDALAAADEAQEEYLSKAEAYAESLKEILENSLNEYAQSLENALTGGTSFDQMNAKLERAASLQEEYLTTTNKIYETNKLMNQAQQEIDKTSNTVAKRKLKSFIDETNQLQQQGKLSQYELEIQQAKYDLLLAEIALEEAQQSKSTVRLQRDSEGNFGYVYTADQDQIAAAQQELADKQNSLYNIALEGANGYAEKYMSTLNEMYDTLTDLQQQYLSGAFESEEEYHNAVTAAKEYYYAKLEEYSDLHSIAIAADTRVIEDAWSSEFNTMINSTEKWQKEVNKYVGLTADAFRQWDKDMDTLTGEMGLGGDLSNLSNAVEDVKNESDDLLITLGDENSGLIGAINKEIDAVDAATGIYALHRAEILQTAAAYEKLAKDIQAVKVAEGKANDSSSSSDTPEPNTSSSSSNEDKSSNSSGNAPNLSIGSAVQVKPGTKWYETSGGRGASGTAHNGEITLINSSGSHAYHIKAPSGKGMGWVKKTDIVGYDTGGYTGEWGSYGKLAMLHEKELILNSRDTENFLSSIELLDNIVKTIDLQAANSQLGGLLKSPSFGNLLQQQQTLEQNVKIEASFPNVQNRTEIEEAFETLVNRASQYANRK